MKYTIKQISKYTNIPQATLRYYDNLGLVSPARGDNKYRYYSDLDLLKLKYIAVLKYSKFSLEQIKVVLDTFGIEKSEKQSKYILKLFQEKQNELNETIRNYIKISQMIDVIFPMINSKNNLENNVENIDNYVEQIYNLIKGEQI